jgi:hypothetical protein
VALAEVGHLTAGGFGMTDEEWGNRAMNGVEKERA